MNVELLREFCLSLPFVTEDFPFDESVLAFRVCNRIFAVINLDNPELATMKCNSEYAIELRDRYSAVEPAFHWNKKYWNQIWFNRDVDDELLKNLIKHSYNEVVKKLPLKERQNLKTLSLSVDYEND